MKSFGITDRGLVRSLNEDAFFLSNDQIGPLPNLYVVADGMGGHNGGEVASHKSIEFLIDYISTHKIDEDVETLLEAAITYANTKVYEQGRDDSSLAGMGTTLVVSTVIDGEVHIANVGDSRFYLMGEDLKQISIDHSVVEELFRAGHISEVEKFHHPDKNMITRAIGVEGKIKVDYFKEASETMTYALLCSDGLTKMVTDVEIEGLLEEEGDVESLSRQLVKTSLDHGGQDNITIVMVDLRNEVAK